MNIHMNLEPDINRVEEIAKNYMTFGTLTHRDYINEIDKVTSEQINKVASKLLKGKPTLVVLGSGINEVPTIGDI